MKINADGIWLSDGTKLEQATQRTLRVAFGYCSRKRKAVAGRVVTAVSQVHGKRWNDADVALWIDNAIREDEIDGAILRLILVAFNENMVKARAKLASDARRKYTEEQRSAIRKKAKALRKNDRSISIREMARDLGNEDGISESTVRRWLTSYFSGVDHFGN